MKQTISIFLLLLGTTFSCTSRDEGKVILRFGHIGFPDSPFDHGSRKFKELLEQKFPGRVEVRIFGSAQLGEDKEMLEGLRLGTVEMHLPSSVLHSVEPMFGVFDLPFLVVEREQMSQIATGPIGEQLAQKLLDHDLVLLGIWENGFRMITNNIRPVIRPEDLSGIKIRTPKDPERVKLFKTFGANPTSMSYGEVFSALKQGVVDGQENPLSQIVPARIHEVQRYLSISRHVYTPAYPLMSRQYLDSLDEDIQIAIREVASSVGSFMRELGAQKDKEYRVMLEDHLEISEIDRDAFFKVAEPLYKEYNNHYGPEFVETIRSYRSQP